MEKIGCFGKQTTQTTQILFVSAESARSAWKDMELWHADYAEYADFFCAESAKATPTAGAVPCAGPKGTHP